MINSSNLQLLCSAAASSATDPSLLKAGLHQGLSEILAHLTSKDVSAFAKTCRSARAYLASNVYSNTTRQVVKSMPPFISAASTGDLSISLRQIAIRCLRKFAELMAEVMIIKPELQKLTRERVDALLDAQTMELVAKCLPELTRERVDALLDARAMCLIKERLLPSHLDISNNKSKNEKELLQSAQEFKDWLNTDDVLDTEMLELQQLQLYSLPGAIGELLHKLTLLNLDGNQLSKLPPAIGQLSKLCTLKLANNQLSQLPPAIGQLHKLIHLDISDNKLTELPPEIGQLFHLIGLNLDNNQLSSLPPAIGQLTELKDLYLKSNQLYSLPPAIGLLLNLTWLSFKNNQLTTLTKKILKLSNLQVLRLEGNQLSMATLPPSVKAKALAKGFTLGEQQPRPVLAEAGAGAGALPPEAIPPKNGKSEERAPGASGASNGGKEEEE